MTYSKIIILLLFFAGSFIYCKAQEENKYVYQDSSAQSADTTSVKTIEAPAADSDASIINVATVPDTILRLNNLVISADSVNALKNLSSFGYAKNMDSLLKDLQKKMQAKEERIEISENKAAWLDNLLGSAGTKIFLWSIAALFILFVLYKLFFEQGIFEKRSNKSNVNESNENQAATNDQDFDKIISQSISNNNYRYAVRYLYLQSLQKLSENGLVQLVADKTNYQYTNELNGTIYKEEFSWLTLNYEYVWYGEFDLNKEAFAQLQNNFKQFNNRLQKS